MAISKIDSDGIVSGGITADSLNVGQIGGRRNAVLNGDMKISQRGTSFAGTSAYTLDRWQSKQAGGGAFTTSQSTDSPDDFTNSLLVTVTTADAIDAASDRYWMETRLEGNSVSHLNFGSSAAKEVTLSFYVKSSIAGTYAGSLLNGDANRSYIFNYTISSANTWERKTVTISGDTTGTWATDTGIGMIIKFNLGSGSDYIASAGSWTASNGFNTSGSTQLISTNSSTWQITGVQLEVGSVATPFEHRSYGEELAACQRYFYSHYNGANVYWGIGYMYSTTQMYSHIKFPVAMRTTPTLSYGGTTTMYANGAASTNNAGSIVIGPASNTSDNNKYMMLGDSTMNEVSGEVGGLYSTGSGAKMQFDAEL